jgi:hypothetical protein
MKDLSTEHNPRGAGNGNDVVSRSHLEVAQITDAARLLFQQSTNLVDKIA